MSAKITTASDFSQNDSSLIFTEFKRALDYTIEINLLTHNPAIKNKATPKSHAIAKYWIKS